MVSSTPILDHYDPEKPVKLCVDASAFAVGAVLTHVYADKVDKAITYASRVLSKMECQYPQIEREGLAIIFSIQKCYDYLYARKFTLVTDHKPLYHIFGKKKVYRYTQLTDSKGGHIYCPPLISTLFSLNPEKMLRIFYRE